MIIRIKVVVLIALLTAIAFVTGCTAIQANEDASYSTVGTSGFEPVLAVTNSGANPYSENARILIRHDDGNYYIIDVKNASARKVDGI